MKSGSHTNHINLAFQAKKEHILKELSKPEDEYTDLSPKGDVDSEIRDFVHEVNTYNGLVTTSSCAGRISVFLEGSKAGTISKSIAEDNAGPQPTPGRWLFTSHFPIDTAVSSLTSLFGLTESSQPTTSCSNRLVHFKFEPFIVHILTDSTQSAHRVLTAAQQAGFRESGATGISETKSTICPMVAVRTNGLAFSSIIGKSSWESSVEKCEALVSEEHIRMLVNVANERFEANTQRRHNFRALLAKNFSPRTESNWEDSVTRRRRKREEGLRRREAITRIGNGAVDTFEDDINLDGNEFT